MRRGTRNDGRFTGLTVLVAIAGFVFFLPPLLTVASTAGLIAGVPAIWAYLFAAWLLVIVLVALIVRRVG